MTYILQCVEEVKSYVQDHYEKGIVPALDGGVVKCDVPVASTILHGIQKASAILRKDYFKPSNSDDSIISNIVDPYLYAFSWEKSIFLKFGTPMTLTSCLESWDNAALLHQPKADECEEKRRYRYPNDMSWSRRFQWAPFDVEFDGHGDGGCKYIHSRQV